MDWDRFCAEFGYTKKIALEVRAAVERAGSIEFLRPIKEQAPEHVSIDFLALPICYLHAMAT